MISGVRPMFKHKNIFFVCAAIFLIVLISTAARVEAHGNLFYSLNPDYYLAKPLTIASSQSLYIFFQPQNDFLNSFDLWLDNLGAPGSATLILRNDAGAILKQTNVWLDTMPVINGGTLTHIDFSDSVPIINTKVYSLEINSSMPALRVYFVNSTEILQHSSNPTLKYLSGVTRINSSEKDFVLKFALYEANDEQAPKISNFLITPANNFNAVTFTFNANEPIDYKLDYGLQGEGQNSGFPYSGTFTICTKDITKCSISISITTGTTYSYTIAAKDEWGNQALFSGQFIVNLPVVTPTPTSTPTPMPSINQTPTPTNSPMPTPTPTPPPGTPTPNPTESPTAPTPSPTEIINPLPINASSTDNSIDIGLPANQAFAGSQTSYVVKIRGVNTDTEKSLTMTPGTLTVQFGDLPEDTYQVQVYENTPSSTKIIAQKKVDVKKAVAPETKSMFEGFTTQWLAPVLILVILGAGIFVYTKRRGK